MDRVPQNTKQIDEILI